jgi:hypothetical protein
MDEQSQDFCPPRDPLMVGIVSLIAQSTSQDVIERIWRNLVSAGSKILAQWKETGGIVPSSNASHRRTEKRTGES